MSKSAMLRVSDVCAAFRLIGDCRDVGDDPLKWQPLAFEGLCRLIGAHAVTGGEGIWLRPTQPVRPMTECVVGFDERAATFFSAYMRAHGVLEDPILQRFQYLAGHIVTHSRSDLVPDVATAGLAAVGIRVPAHPVALALIRAAGVPVAAPSANRSTELSPTSAEPKFENPWTPAPEPDVPKTPVPGPPCASPRTPAELVSVAASINP